MNKKVNKSCDVNKNLSGLKLEDFNEQLKPRKKQNLYIHILNVTTKITEVTLNCERYKNIAR